MKPTILYIDDEPNNLTVFEASMPDEWNIVVDSNPISILNRLNEINPWIILSDQKMPGMKGVEFLELAKKLVPNAVRMIVTGYSDEDLVIASVRKAQIFDYIRKPWDTEHLEVALRRGIDHYRLNTERDEIVQKLREQTIVLEARQQALEKATIELELAGHRERLLRMELECWVPPFVLAALKNPQIEFPVHKDLVGITFDIVGSSKIHGHFVHGKSLRARVLEVFSEAILRHGGFRESHAGDSAYAHFGLMGEASSYGEAALAAAREFRVGLRSIGQIHGCPVECGIALHAAHNAVVDIHTVQLNTPLGTLTQKSFDTASAEIDLLHRIEKLIHRLPGSNIIMTEAFLKLLSQQPKNLIEIGPVAVIGQDQPVLVYILPSDLVQESDLADFRAQFVVELLKVAA